MQQHSKEWLGKRAQEILERNVSCNTVATKAEKPATTMASGCCTKRGVFNFWLADEEHPCVMISGTTSIEDARESLQATFGDRITRVERIGSEGLAV